MVANLASGVIRRFNVDRENPIDKDEINTSLDDTNQVSSEDPILENLITEQLLEDNLENTEI